MRVWKTAVSEGQREQRTSPRDSTKERAGEQHWQTGGKDQDKDESDHRGHRPEVCLSVAPSVGTVSVDLG